ncbi:MAG TPA: hypothetical protein ENF44_00040, partial [Deltaproteobacteria bacterium]|nr:hypothetical protein [Deltaproteobacteria bacterium]
MKGTGATAALNLRAFSGDLTLALGAVGILAIMILPIPSAGLDFLIPLNITLSIVVLLVAMYA